MTGAAEDEVTVESAVGGVPAAAESALAAELTAEAAEAAEAT